MFGSGEYMNRHKPCPDRKLCSSHRRHRHNLATQEWKLKREVAPTRKPQYEGREGPRSYIGGLGDSATVLPGDGVLVALGSPVVLKVFV